MSMQIAHAKPNLWISMYTNNSRITQQTVEISFLPLSHSGHRIHQSEMKMVDMTGI